MATRNLTAAFIETAKQGVYSDGGKQGQGYLSTFGLRLVVSPYGRKRFVQRLWFAGKQRDIPIGSTDLVSLKDARAQARANWETARRGGDPRRVKQDAQTEVKPPCPTFSEGLEACIALRNGTLSAKAATGKRNMMANHAAAIMGERLDDIDSAAVLKVLAPIWADHYATAKQIKGNVGEVLDWAIARGHRQDNPITTVTKALPKPNTRVAARPAVAHSETAKALAALVAAEKTKLALTLQVLTATRPSEAQGARWSEIDLAGAVWVIPASRMKAKKEHRVPLSRQAAAVLEQAKAHSEGDSVFGGSAASLKQAVGRAMRTLAWASDQAGKVAVAHGFRSSFRNWAGELSGAGYEAIERSLAHTVASKVEAAYNRTDLLERRRQLMQQWADYLTK